MVISNAINELRTLLDSVCILLNGDYAQLVMSHSDYVSGVMTALSERGNCGFSLWGAGRSGTGLTGMSAVDRY